MDRSFHFIIIGRDKDNTNHIYHLFTDVATKELAQREFEKIIKLYDWQPFQSIRVIRLSNDGGLESLILL